MVYDFTPPKFLSKVVYITTPHYPYQITPKNPTWDTRGGARHI